jgi:hypothetical protein
MPPRRRLANADITGDLNFWESKFEGADGDGLSLSQTQRDVLRLA